MTRRLHLFVCFYSPTEVEMTKESISVHSGRLIPLNKLGFHM